jgi:adenylate cyclase
MLTARTLSYLVAVVVVSAVLIGAREVGWLQFLELKAYDQFLRWRADAGPADPRIVLVAIDAEDIDRYGYPVPDGTMAQALTRIGAADPRVIGLDLLRDKEYPPGTAAFHDVLRHDDRIIGIRTLPSATEPGTEGPAPLAENGRVALADLPRDPDGTQRRGAIFLDRNGDGDYSLATRVAIHYLEQDAIKLDEDQATGSPRIGAVTLAPLPNDFGGYRGTDFGGYLIAMDYLHGIARFQSFSLRRLLDPATDLGAMRDRIVLIGMTTKSVPDFFETPFAEGGRFDGVVYGVEIWGHLTGQLLRLAAGETPLLRSPPRWAGWIVILGGALLGGLAGVSLRHPLLLLLVLAAGGAALGAACFIAFQAFWWLPVVPLELAWVIAAVGVRLNGSAP